MEVRSQPGPGVPLPQWQVRMQWCSMWGAAPRLTNSLCLRPYFQRWILYSNMGVLSKSASTRTYCRVVFITLMFGDFSVKCYVSRALFLDESRWSWQVGLVSSGESDHSANICQCGLDRSNQTSHIFVCAFLFSSVIINGNPNNVNCLSCWTLTASQLMSLWMPTLSVVSLK